MASMRHGGGIADDAILVPTHSAPPSVPRRSALARWGGPARYTDFVDRKELIDRVEEYFRVRGEGLSTVYLYGSRARGTDGPESDVDLGVLFAAPQPPRLGGPADRIADDLGRLLRREVQVVDLARAPADLVHRVLRDGVLVLEADRSARVRFEVDRRREYLDLLPVLQRYRHPRPRIPEPVA
jgi:predicted nucleotidyltransferase